MPLKLSDLTPDVRKYVKESAVSAEGTAPSEAVLAAIGVSIGKLRDEAKAARIASGIEDRWRDAEEAYAGIDDANRGDVSGDAQWTKSMSLNGPISSDDVPDTNNRSTLFPLMTQRYVNAASDKVCEVLLLPGGKSFSISATPLPELIDAKDDKSQIRLDHLPGAPVAMIAAQPDEIGAAPAPPSGALPVPAPAGGAVPPAGAAGPVLSGVPTPGAAPMRPLTPSDLAAEKMEQADKAAKKAETRISDWHVECRRTPQVRKVIFDSARIGVGVLKGPVPMPSRQIATRKGKDGVEMGIRKVILPGSKWVNPWNFFPDASGGEDTQDGDYNFEREWLGERGVRKLRPMPGYIRAQIDKVILEGPQKIHVKEDGKPAGEDADGSQSKKGKYEVWYFYGTLTREEMGCICEAAGEKEAKKFNDNVPADREQVYAIVTMINDSVVRATINPLDSGEFPYHTMPWKRRVGSWAGMGVAEQISAPQKMLTNSIRAMLDNAGISAGGQIVIDTSVVTPADGEMGMSPHKVWYVNGEGERLDVNAAFGLFKVDNVTAELMQIVNLAMRQGEESTSIPLVTQGLTGPTTPDTLGATQIQNSNANQLVRSIAYTFDDNVTVPETNQYYEWLLLDPDVPDDEKGDWTIDAHGSNALVEQAIQDQTIAQILPLAAAQAAYGLSPKRTMEMYLRSKKLQPKDFQYTEEEQAKLDQAPPPAAPAVEVAKIRAQVDTQKIAAIQADTQADNERADKKLLTDSTVALNKLKIEMDLAMEKFANDNGMALNDVKAQLAKTAMTLEAQERMADKGQRNGRRSAPQVARPAVEPAGRAKPGEAFQA